MANDKQSVNRRTRFARSRNTLEKHALHVLAMYYKSTFCTWSFAPENTQHGRNKPLFDKNKHGLPFTNETKSIKSTQINPNEK